MEHAAEGKGERGRDPNSIDAGGMGVVSRGAASQHAHASVHFSRAFMQYGVADDAYGDRKWSHDHDQ